MIPYASDHHVPEGQKGRDYDRARRRTGTMTSHDDNPDRAGPSSLWFGFLFLAVAVAIVSGAAAYAFYAAKETINHTFAEYPGGLDSRTAFVRLVPASV